MDIRTLEEWSDWFMWKQDVTTALKCQGWGFLLKRETKPPRKLEAWEDCQRQAVTIVRSSLGYRHLDLVKGMTTVLEIVDAIDTWFQGYKTTAFLVLSHEYESLTLEGCTNVADYVEKLLTVRRKIEQLDESCRIGEAQFINRFLTGLGRNYETFLVIFHMNHSLVPEYKDGKIIKRRVTFGEAVEAALLHESLHNHDKQTSVSFPCAPERPAQVATNQDINKKGAGSYDQNYEQKQQSAAGEECRQECRQEHSRKWNSKTWQQILSPQEKGPNYHNGRHKTGQKPSGAAWHARMATRCRFLVS
ncbi:hypothetical protein CFAM422_010210 [Trichoderma lentiforme]|uniref:Uncharacterized protein n=1 Tax=Trichoderma lentiforme TaxID=1567552 RepID=A0A9P5C8A6_9HYPO|nr:hypothetical protein CFAM422_010210 [Trichoderma lentiforme]